MNALYKVASDTPVNIPSNPRERSLWFMDQYGDRAKSHISHLKRFGIVSQKDQALKDQAFSFL